MRDALATACHALQFTNRFVNVRNDDDLILLAERDALHCEQIGVATV